MKKETESGLHSGRKDTSAKKAFRTEGFRNPDARKSADSIVSRDIEKMRGSRGPENGVVREKERRYAAPGPGGRSYRPPVTRGNGDTGKAIDTPRKSPRESDRRSIVPRTTERSFNRPEARSMERRFIAPRQSDRTFNAPLRGGERPRVSTARKHDPSRVSWAMENAVSKGGSPAVIGGGGNPHKRALKAEGDRVGSDAFFPPSS
jgi:hypothetical protein